MEETKFNFSEDNQKIIEQSKEVVKQDAKGLCWY